ncbi:MAG: thioesterase family protein [Bacteroidota bacterium]
MFTHETKVRVRYAETDKMGYLYYGHYPKYYEIGRVEAMRFLGVRYRDLEDKHGMMMPVMSLNMRYVRPGYYDDLLTIKTTIRHLPEKTITYHHEIFNEKGKLVNGGSVKLCFVEMASNKSVAAPRFLLDPLASYFEQ